MYLIFLLFSALNKRCGGTFESDFGWITSPDLDFDDKYDYNVDCYWTVHVSDNDNIEFQVLYVEIAFSMDCRDDYLEVMKWNNNSHYG